MTELKRALFCSFGLTKTLDFILRFLAMAMTEQAHHCSSGLTKTFTCVQLSDTYLSATLTTATFPTAATCRGFDVSACTPTPRDLLSSHWQLRLHLIWKVANPLYIDVRLVAHGQVHRPKRVNQCPLTLLTLDDFYSSFVRNPSIVPFSDEKLMPRAITLRLSAA